MSNAKPASFRLYPIVAALIAILLIAVVCLFGVVGWGLMTGHIADTKVLPGDKLQPRVVQSISTSAGLAPGEQIQYFYSAAMTPAGDGNLLTNQRVISYVDDGTDAWCSSIAIDDIVSVNFIKSDSWLEDSTIVVVSSDGSELTLYASNEDGGDERFVEAIRRAAKLDSR
jgi:hypothetical protein